MTGRIRAVVAVLILVTGGVLSGCSVVPNAAGTSPAGNEPLRVVATTPILADLAQRIGGSEARATSLVPAGADPHSYEPGLRDIRDIAYADLALTNGMLLEQQKLRSTVQSNLSDGSKGAIPVAERIEKYGGSLRPMTEDLSLDTVWLGLRSEGGRQDSAGRSDESCVTFRTDRIKGGGHTAAFVSGTFGRVTKVADSEADGARRRSDGNITGDLGSIDLPPDAHTHLSWGFTESGLHEVEIRAQAPGVDVPPSTVYFAVGTDAHEAAESIGPHAHILDGGHVDVTVDLTKSRMVLRAETDHGAKEYDPAETVIAVPAKSLQELPSGAQYRFLGRPGEQVYLLAQAVLGEHVHGEIDPHFWHSVPNTKAAAEVIRDQMIAAAPSRASLFEANTRDLLRNLDGLDRELRTIYDAMPKQRRSLITTHDGYGYLADTYGLKVEGFVAPAPGTEPGLQQRRRLSRAITDLHIPAVFVDKGTIGRGNVLQQVSREHDVEVCELYSDTLDKQAPHYEDMMRANATTISRCLEP